MFGIAFAVSLCVCLDCKGYPHYKFAWKSTTRCVPSGTFNQFPKCNSSHSNAIHTIARKHKVSPIILLSFPIWCFGRQSGLHWFRWQYSTGITVWRVGGELWCEKQFGLEFRCSMLSQCSVRRSLCVWPISTGREKRFYPDIQLEYTQIHIYRMGFAVTNLLEV